MNLSKVRSVIGNSGAFHFLQDIKRYFLFLREYSAFRKMQGSTDKRFSLVWRDRFPCLNNKTTFTTFDRHYVFHPAWAARIVARVNPRIHVDISSTLHFCTIVSAFVPVKFYDFRPANLNLDNLETGAADLMALPFGDSSIPSLSCMHTIEHVGLGRYGDRLDPDGDLKAIAELQRVIKKEGHLLIVVPVGRPKIMFNAHRIYSYAQMVRYFDKLTLVEFSLIPDTGEERMIMNATEQDSDKCNYGCGCFWFKK